MLNCQAVSHHQTFPSPQVVNWCICQHIAANALICRLNETSKLITVGYHWLSSDIASSFMTPFFLSMSLAWKIHIASTSANSSKYRDTLVVTADTVTTSVSLYLRELAEVDAIFFFPRPEMSSSCLNLLHTSELISNCRTVTASGCITPGNDWSICKNRSKCTDLSPEWDFKAHHSWLSLAIKWHRFKHHEPIFSLHVSSLENSHSIDFGPIYVDIVLQMWQLQIVQSPHPYPYIYVNWPEVDAMCVHIYI